MPPPDDQSSEETIASEWIDEDWLNMFSDYAEKASTDRLQQTWAKILAGEIRKPKSFSLRALRFVSELDQDTASLFEKLLKNRLNEYEIVRPTEIEGNDFYELSLLEETGLCQPGSTNRYVRVKTDERGEVIIYAKYWLVNIEGPPNQFVEYQPTFLTHLGAEIASILPFEDNEEAVRQFASSIKNKGYKVSIKRVQQNLISISEAKIREAMDNYVGPIEI